ncbi:protein of unknown function [Nitratireductor aquimarinus]
MRCGYWSVSNLLTAFVSLFLTNPAHCHPWDKKWWAALQSRQLSIVHVEAGR